MNARRKSLIGSFAFAAMLFSFNKSQPPPVECSARSQGVFWPTDANHDPRFLQSKAAAGDLWLCRGDYDWDAYFIQTIHFFKWQRVTVHVSPRKPLAQAAANSSAPLSE